MPPVRETAQGLLEGQGLLDLGVDVGAREPVVAQLGAAVEVYGSDDAHVALAPFPAAVGDLGFEELERVQAEVVVGDLEALAEDRAGFVLDEKQAPVRFVPRDLLHDVEVVDGGEEVSEGVCGDGFLGKGSYRVAQFVNFGAHTAFHKVGSRISKLFW